MFFDVPEGSLNFEKLQVFPREAGTSCRSANPVLCTAFEGDRKCWGLVSSAH